MELDLVSVSASSRRYRSRRCRSCRHRPPDPTPSTATGSPTAALQQYVRGWHFTATVPPAALWPDVNFGALR